MNKTIVFLGILALCAGINAEFLFEKNVAAEDKFMCLHKKLYRNERPPVKLNAARILSLRRNLQSLESDADATNLKNYICEANRLTFQYKNTFCDAVTKTLAAKKFTLYFRSDEFKQIVVESANYVYESKKTLGQAATVAILETEAYLNDVAAEVSKRIDTMMNTLLGTFNVKQAAKDGIAYERIVYVMLNILSLFKEDVVVAREAYQNYYSSNKDQLTGSAFNSEAVVRWIESIKKRYVAIKTQGTPDRETILEPATESGFSTPETPVGTFLEPVPSVQTPTPKELEEEEPTVIEPPKGNEDYIIKDMLIEIQRTYNVEKMLLTYHQLTSSLKIDIQSCQLNLKPALARCEKAFGVDKCEVFGPTMAVRKCPVGYSREGCCRCVVDCPDSDFYTINRSICEMKTQLHMIPQIYPATATVNDAVLSTELNAKIAPCPAGYDASSTGVFCYKKCPTGTTAIGSSACLKNTAINLGTPFQWTAGDE